MDCTFLTLCQLHHVQCEGCTLVLVHQLRSWHADAQAVKIVNFRDSILEWCIKQINIVVIMYYCTIRSNLSFPPEKHSLELFR